MTDGLHAVALGDITLSTTSSQHARRERFNAEALAELTDSVRTHGVLQPIILRPYPHAGSNGAPPYELVAGERRYLAAQTAELAEIPALVRTLTDEQVLEVQLIENLQRADLHPMEEAQGYESLMREHGHPIEELHARVGKSRSYVYGRLKLLALCEAVRTAFYAGKVSASVALLIARLPSPKLQRAALNDLTRSRGDHYQMTARKAQEHLRQHYMTRLRGAPFPKDDERVNGSAGPCHACPKRTGNQPELFEDVSADVCTDPPCFAAKTRAWGKIAIAEAKQAGQPVLTGAEAKKVCSYGGTADHYLEGGYVRLDQKIYSDRRQRTAKKILGANAEPTLLQEPATGKVVLVVKRAAVDAVLRKNKPRKSTTDPMAGQKRKTKLERAYRRELYDRLRSKLPEPTLRQVTEFLITRLDQDTRGKLCGLRDVEVTVSKQHGYTFRDVSGALEAHLKGLPDDQLGGFLNDCIHVGELQVSSWNLDSKPERMLAAAKAVGVSAAAARTAVIKRAKKKKARKKPAKKTRKKAAKRSGRKGPARKKAGSRRGLEKLLDH